MQPKFFFALLLNPSIITDGLLRVHYFSSFLPPFIPSFSVISSFLGN